MNFNCLVLFDIEYWLMVHCEEMTYLCNVYYVISQNNDKQKVILFLNFKTI